MKYMLKHKINHQWLICVLFCFNYHQIDIESDFYGFTCNPYWREYNYDGTLEQAYTADSNGIYVVKQEKDLRFHCTWTRIGNRNLFICRLEISTRK